MNIKLYKIIQLKEDSVRVKVQTKFTRKLKEFSKWKRLFGGGESNSGSRKKLSQQCSIILETKMIKKRIWHEGN